jgi:tetratricopeptide (TPR) repeat protein
LEFNLVPLGTDCGETINHLRSEHISPEQLEAIQSTAARRKLVDVAVWLGLIASILVVYAQVGAFEFTVYDDGPHVYENPSVQAGLTPASIKSAFTGVVLSNWIPVAQLSHMAVSELFGMESGVHHLANVFFHMLAAGFLYMALRRATGAPGPSAFVAFVFAVHPLHVGSVAWVSERKDVLAALFWFLALYAYVRYTERPSLARYALVAGAFCLGLMSKPMLVTFPFTLVLFDIWPLRRFSWPQTVVEKLPLLFLCAAEAAVTYFLQGTSGALFLIPFKLRILNAFLSYVTYLRQTFLPSSLAVFYPYPHKIFAWNAGLALLTILLLTAAALLVRRTRPYLLVGWFWFVGTLVPVIGLVQAGEQAHADRYMYIPMVGILIALAWSGVDIIRRWPRTKFPIAAGAALCGIACIPIAWKETSYWHDDQALLEHTIAVTGNNWLAEDDLGIYFYRQQRDADAISHFQAAVRLEPLYVEARSNLGVALLRLEGCAGAVPQFEAVLKINPKFAQANHILGKCQAIEGDYAAAIPYLEAAIREDPGRVEARDYLGLSLSKTPGRVPEAILQYEEALRLSPDDETAQEGLRELLDR